MTRSLVVFLVLIPAVLACAPEASTTQSASRAETGSPVAVRSADPITATESQPAPAELNLPAKALLSLAELQPPVETPTTKPIEAELPESARQAMTEATALQEKGNLAGAVEKLDRARGFAPDHPEIHRRLALAYLAMGNTAKAEDHLKRTLPYHGDRLAVQYMMARLDLLAGRDDQALRRLRLALQCSDAKPEIPETAMTMFALAEQLEKQGYLTAALEANQTLTDWLNEHGRAYRSSKPLTALMLQPEMMMIKRGILLVRLGKTEQGIEQLDRAYRMNRSNWLTASALLSALRKAERFDRAQEVLIELASSANRPDALAAEASELINAVDDPALPKRFWDAYRKQHDADEALGLAMARAAWQREAHDDARVILQSLLDDDPDNASALALLAEWTGSQSDPGQALRLLTELLVKAPQNTDAIDTSVSELVKAQPDHPAIAVFHKDTYTATGESKFAMHYVAGVSARQQGNLLKAADHFRRSVEARPGFLAGYEALLNLLPDVPARDRQILREQLDEAINATRRQQGQAYLADYLRARLLLQAGKMEDALDALELARRKNPGHAETLMLLGQVSRQQAALARQENDNRLEARAIRRAIDAYEELIQRAPTQVEAYQALFVLYARAKDFNKAGEVARELIRQNPDSLDGLLMTGRLYILTNQHKELATLLAQIKQRFPDRPEVTLLTVRAELSLFPAALPKPVVDQTAELLHNLLKNHPGNEDALGLLARRIYPRALPPQQGKAAAAWGDLFRQGRQNLTIGRSYANALLAAGQAAKALAVVETLLTANENDPALKLMQIDALIKTDQTDRAITLMNDWLEREPTNARLWQVLISVLIRDEQFDEAIDTVDRLQREQPGAQKSALNTLRMEILLKAGRYDSLITLWREDNLEISPNVLAYELMQHEQFEKAREVIDQALNDKPNAVLRSRLNLINMLSYIEQENLDQAEAVLNEALKDKPFELDLREILLGSLFQVGQYDRALSLVKTWQEQLDSQDDAPGEVADNLKYLFRSAPIDAALSQGQANKALSLIDPLVDKNPNDARLLNLKATVLGELGRDDEAIQLLRRANKLKPDDAGYQNNLAYSLAEQGKDLDEARKLIEQSTRKNPGSIASLDTLGWVLYKQGHWSRAGQLFYTLLKDPESASSQETDGGPLDLSSVHPIIWDHAGDAMYRLGWDDLARAYWKRALDQAKATKDTDHTQDLQFVLKNTPAKLRALEAGLNVPVARPGENVAPPAWQQAPNTQPTPLTPY